MPERRGFFITFEGPEGSGKSSQVHLLEIALRSPTQHVFPVSDPGETELGKRLRTLLLDIRMEIISTRTDALMFFAARAELMEEKILPLLKEGIVICDRFHDSTIAYQGYGSQLNIEELEKIGRWAIGNRMPDLTFLLNLPPELGFKRLNRSLDRIEQRTREFYQRVYEGYRKIAKNNKDRVISIDATKSEKAIHDQILHIVRDRLALKVFQE
jgi:dTMP kinase